MNRFLTYIKSGFPLIWIKSYEEQRVLTECTHSLSTAKATDSEGNEDTYKVLSWDTVAGLRPLTINDRDLNAGAPIEETAVSPFVPLEWLRDKADDNTVIFLNDYHPFLEKEFPDKISITRLLKNICSEFKAKGKALVILSAGCTIPMELEKEVALISYKLPNKDELRTVLHDLCVALEAPYPRQDESIIDASTGMTSMEAENIYAAVYQESGRFDPTLIVKEKAEIIKKSGLLEVVEATETLNDIGGLENMKDWLVTRAECFTDKARRFGIEPPKGMLLVGVPGSGKSLAIKAIAAAWNRPCLRLDMGRIYNSLLGESEHNMEKVLDIASASAPCILWIDEIEKALSGNKSGQESHETSRKMFQTLLTWMQERKADVFLAATANSVSSLPPELLRAGRIDVKFWVDLPDSVQRQEILAIHLRKRGRDIATYQNDVPRLVAACDTFTGAEIEMWIKEALVHAYHARHDDLMAEDLIATQESVVPISKLAAQDIAQAREWSVAHGILMASASHATTIIEPVKRSRKVQTN